MDQQASLPVSLPTPVRVSFADQPLQLLQFLREAAQSGRVALATLVEIRGGAARALGSHVAIADDGRFCGYVSGGCVEAAVVSEALLAIRSGQDRTIKFGEGSPFFDIVLPCGGGITVAIHVLRDITPIEDVLCRLRRRERASLVYEPAAGSLCLGNGTQTGWSRDCFENVYRPATRLVVSGATAEAYNLAHLAAQAGYDVLASIDDPGRRIDAGAFDPFTAVVLLHHDLDAEGAILEAALRSPAFYIGALGSTRTHRRRVERLLEYGFEATQIERIRAPIGLFGPTRDSTSLALSVLADVAATRLMTQ